MRVFHPHRFHHHNATDPVPVSDIKWSRACKLSHSVAEAPILASTLLAQKTDQPLESTTQPRSASPFTEQQLLLRNRYISSLSSFFIADLRVSIFDPKVIFNQLFNRNFHFISILIARYKCRWMVVKRYNNVSNIIILINCFA